MLCHLYKNVQKQKNNKFLSRFINMIEMQRHKSQHIQTYTQARQKK